MRVPSRVMWRCRRGMRELDLVLERFCERGYAGLDAGARESFERLLECPDQDILAWLWGDSVPGDERIADIVCAMRDVLEER